MHLQLRKSEFHRFCILVVSSKQNVIRVHYTPRPIAVKRFFDTKTPLDKDYWLKGNPYDDNPEFYGELVAVRGKSHCKVLLDDLLEELKEELADLNYTARKHYQELHKRATWIEEPVPYRWRAGDDTGVLVAMSMVAARRELRKAVPHGVRIFLERVRDNPQ